MSWVRAVLRLVVPSFGGIPVFCEDPDCLLEVPEVRDTLRKAGLTLLDWDGTAESLEQLKRLSDDAKVLVIVRDSYLRHVVELQLHDFSWCAIGLGHIFPKFNYDVVRSVPLRYWDQLYTLHQHLRTPHNPLESGLLIARVIYGVDPLHLINTSGWLRSLVEVSCNGEGLPQPITDAIHYFLCNTYGNAPAVELLTQPEMAWALLRQELKERPDLRHGASFATEQLLQVILRERVANGKLITSVTPFDEVVAQDAGIDEFLSFGLRFAAGVAQGTVAEPHRSVVHQVCVDWLRRNYHLALMSHNPAVLRLSSLVDTLDEEVATSPLLLIIADGMSLSAWFQVAQTWQATGVIGGSHTRAAFAIVPTVTAISRRAIFEGRLPSSFSTRPHSTRLERVLWQGRFPHYGDYFSADETQGIRDAIALGKRRLCIVDTTWDERCHRMMPEIDELNAAAEQWARRTGLGQTIADAFRHGYRVVVTSDHGQITCQGRGRPSVGEVIESRCKRAIVFQTRALAEQYRTEHSFVFKPPGLPPDFWPLFAGDFTSFDNPGILSVSHGGLSLDEVLVPVAEVYDS